MLLHAQRIRRASVDWRYPRPRRLHARIKQAAVETGLLCYPMGGTIDGVHGDHALLAPPFIIAPT